MKIPIVSAATSQTGKAAEPATTAGAKEAKDAKTSFSSVLDSQKAPQAALAQGARNPAAKANQAKDDAPAKSDEEVLSLLVAGQGLIQQPLALNPAIQAGTAAETSEANLKGQATPASRTGSTRAIDSDNLIASAAQPDAPSSSPGISPDAVARVIQEQLAAANTPAGASPGPMNEHDSKAGDRISDKLKSRPAISPQSTTGATASATAAASQQAALAPHSFSNASADSKPLHLAQDVAQASTLTAVNINPPGAQGTPGAASGMAATASPTVLRIDTPLHNPQWANDFGRQFVSLTSNHAQSQTAELHINPPNLGPLHISINISDNVAHAIFMSPHAAVRGAVENALPQLQQALAQNGISLGQANVSDQQQSAGSFQEHTGQKRRGAVGAIAGTATEQGIVGQARIRSVSPDSLVDTFA